MAKRLIFAVLSASGFGLLGGVWLYGRYARWLRAHGLDGAALLMLYAFRIYGMLAIQFTFIPLAFALFPVGFLLQIVSIADLLVRRGEQPWLCASVHLQSPACPPALVSFHIGHWLLVVAALKYGQTLFDGAADLYHAGIIWIAQRLKEP